MLGPISWSQGESMKHILIGICIVLGILLLIGNTQGDLITVDDSGGKDHLTIQAAVDAASNNDNIKVYAGTYAETVNITNKDINIYNNPGDTVTVTGGGGSTDWGFNIVDGDGLWIEGIDIDDVIHGIRVESTDGIRIEYVNITNIDYTGIRLKECSDYWIEHIFVDGTNTPANDGYGIYIFSTDDTNGDNMWGDCRDLTIQDMGKSGIRIEWHTGTGASDIVLRDILIDNVGENGFHIKRSKNIRIVDCTTDNTGEYGVKLMNCAGDASNPIEVWESDCYAHDSYAGGYDNVGEDWDKNYYEGGTGDYTMDGDAGATDTRQVQTAYDVDPWP